MDQLNGLFAFISISAKLAAFILPTPVASFTGHRVCAIIDISGRLYLTGATTWSSYIGLYRVLYIKAQVVEMRLYFQRLNVIAHYSADRSEESWTNGT